MVIRICVILREFDTLYFLKAGGLSLRLFTENNEGLAFVLIVNTRFLDSLPIKLRQLSWRGFILNLQV